MVGVIFFAMRHSETKYQFTLPHPPSVVTTSEPETEQLTAEYRLVGSTQKSFTGTLSISAGSTGEYSTEVPFPPTYFRVFDVWNVVVRKVDQETMVGGMTLRVNFAPQPKPQFRIQVTANQESSNKTLTIKGWA
jgi:hypothetical protein